MVATSSPVSFASSTAASPPTVSATTGDGTFFVTLGHRRSSANVSTPMPRSCRCVCGSASASSFARGMKWSENFPGRPSSLSTCVAAMTTAMPLVKPVVTGCGMNWISRPRRSSPIATRMKPAITVASISPPSPYCDAMGARMTMKAAVGPVTCAREPPRSATTPPATMAV